MKLLDANVLLYAYNSDSFHQEGAVSGWNKHVTATSSHPTSYFGQVLMTSQKAHGSWGRDPADASGGQIADRAPTIGDVIPSAAASELSGHGCRTCSGHRYKV